MLVAAFAVNARITEPQSRLDHSGGGYAGVVLLIFLVACDPPVATGDSHAADPAGRRTFGTLSLADAPVRYTGVAAGDAAGSASAGGDLDGDGVGDWVIGARNANAGAGAVFVVRGPVAGGSLADADVRLEEGGSRELGWSVAVIPDLDGDGAGEILVGAPSSSDHAGEAWRLPGTLVGSVDSSAAIARFVGTERSEAGVRVGDSGEGWFVGAWLDAAAGYQAGALYLFDAGSGVFGPGDAIASRTGEQAEDWSAYGLSMADATGDGVFDLLVGADGSDRAAPDAGAAYFEPGPIVGHGTLASATAILAGAAERDFAGHAVLIAGDVFGHGAGSVLVGALGVGDSDRVGAVYAYGTVATGEGSVSSAPVLLDGPGGDTLFGYSLASAGDVDGDGLFDVMVGARYDEEGGYHAGATWLMYGPLDAGPSTETAVRFAGEFAEDDAGYNPGGAADVDGDGVEELLFGAMGNDVAAPGAGAVYAW